MYKYELAYIIAFLPSLFALFTLTDEKQSAAKKFAILVISITFAVVFLAIYIPYKKKKDEEEYNKKYSSLLNPSKVGREKSGNAGDPIKVQIPQ